MDPQPKRSNLITHRKSTAASSQTIASQRERKRATDRRAQRDHRERHKAYVRELEETVRLLSKENKSDEKIAALLTEQSRLKERCNLLTVRLERILNIALEERPVPAARPSEPDCNDDSSQSAGKDSGKASGSEEPVQVSIDSSWDSTAFTDLFVFTTDDSPGSLEAEGGDSDRQNTDLLECAAGRSKGNQCPPREHHDDFLLDVGSDQTIQSREINANAFLAGRQRGHDYDFAIADPYINLGYGTEQTTDGPCERHPMLLSLAEWSPSTSLSGNNLVTEPFRVHQDVERLGQGSLQIPVSLGLGRGVLPRWLVLPNYQSPCTHRESIYSEMINEGRAEHRAGRFDTTEPTLSRLLSKEPVDTLSFRLFHYMSTWGPLPMNLFLAIFWLHYLYLRWHVLLNESSYYKIPEFLRPNHLECLMPHRLSVNLLIWPDIRAVLISEAGRLDPDEIAVELYSHSNALWSPVDPTSLFTHTPSNSVSYNMGRIKSITGQFSDIDTNQNLGIGIGALTGLDIIGTIEKHASTLEFWRIERSFVSRYPCFKTCNLG